ncbi:MAG: DJ-1 family glyoxalase III [Oscillospiraceae bacterium]
MIYVFLANGFEEVEAFTPIDYLRRCEELDVKTVGVGGKMIQSAHNITIIADISVFDIKNEKIEMVVLPGGMPGTINLEKSSQVIDTVNYCIENNIPVAAICAAPSILGHLGHLKGKKATCAEGFSDELIGAEYTGEPVEVDGNIITARGAGVANQFAFAIVSRLLGNDRVQKLKGSIRWAE